MEGDSRRATLWECDDNDKDREGKQENDDNDHGDETGSLPEEESGKGCHDDDGGDGDDGGDLQYDTNPYVLCGGRGPPFTMDHDCMLRQINLILHERNWPTGDVAIPQEISQLVSTPYVSSKRLRSVAGVNHFNPAPVGKRRAGATVER